MEESLPTKDLEQIDSGVKKISLAEEEKVSTPTESNLTKEEEL